MGKILSFLNGYKTYLTAIAAILTSIVAYLNHAITGVQCVTAMFTAVQSCNIRHAITTTVSDATDKKL